MPTTTTPAVRIMVFFTGFFAVITRAFALAVANFLAVTSAASSPPSPTIPFTPFPAPLPKRFLTPPVKPLRNPFFTLVVAIFPAPAPTGTWNSWFPLTFSAK